MYVCMCVCFPMCLWSSRLCWKPVYTCTPFDDIGLQTRRRTGSTHTHLFFFFIVDGTRCTRGTLMIHVYTRMHILQASARHCLLLLAQGDNTIVTTATANDITPGTITHGDHSNDGTTAVTNHILLNCVGVCSSLPYATQRGCYFWSFNRCRRW